MMMLPWAVPGVIVGVVWLWLLDSSIGLINGCCAAPG